VISVTIPKEYEKYLNEEKAAIKQRMELFHIDSLFGYAVKEACRLNPQFEKSWRKQQVILEMKSK